MNGKFVKAALAPGMAAPAWSLPDSNAPSSPPFPVPELLPETFRPLMDEFRPEGGRFPTVSFWAGKADEALDRLYSTGSPEFRGAGGASNFSSLRERQRIVDVDTEIPDSVLDLAVTK